MKVVLSVQDEAGAKHDILSDDFGGFAMQDALARLSQLEAFVAELMNRDAIVGKEMREKAAVFVKARS